MGFSDEDQILTKNLCFFKGCGAKEHIMEFPNKDCRLRGLKTFEKAARSWHDGYR